MNNAPQTRFNTSFYGKSPNRIYGLLQCQGNICQGNISSQDCSICSQEANDSVIQLCGKGIGARVWLERCFLRYENFSLFSKLDTNGTYLVMVIEISTSNLYNFKTTTSNLLFNVSNEACNSTNKGFTQGSATCSANGTVYSLVQCWRDLSRKDYRSCFQLPTNNLHRCRSLNGGAQALSGSFRVRYEIYPSFNTSTAGNSG